MPFIEENEEERRRREEAEGGGVPVSGTQTGTIPGADGNKPMGGKPENAFVDVAAYLDANREQSMDTANKVAGKLGEEEQGLRSGLQSASDEYGRRVEAGTVRPDDELVDRAATRPTEFVGNQDDLQRFFKQRDAEYTGPGSFEETPEFGALLQRVKSGQEKAKSIDTSEGRKTYLHSVGNNPTAGVVSLDDLLIGGDQNARKKLTAAAAPFETLTGALDDATKKASESLTAGRGNTEAARTGVANRFTVPGGVLPTFQEGIDKRLAETRTKAQTDADALRQQISAGGSLTAEEQKALGLENWDEIRQTRAKLAMPTPFHLPEESLSQSEKNFVGDIFRYAPGLDGIKYDRDIDMSPYLTQENADVAFTRENIASADEYAQERALQTLMGDQFDILPDDPRLAGTAPSSLSRIQGDPGGDLSKLLKETDTAYLDRLGDYNIPANEHEGVIGSWQTPIQNNPYIAESFRNLTDIIQRNPETAHSTAQRSAYEIEKFMRDYFGENYDRIGSGGGDDYRPGTPGNVESNRLRVLDGQMKWWDGGGWVQAPPETKTNADGSWEQFNYDTGQYEPRTGTRPVLRAS